MKKEDLPTILESELRALEGSATILEVCKRVWADYETDLRGVGELVR